MDLYVLDTEFQTLALLDIYDSFIWTDRYDEYGDFEAYLSPHTPVMEYLVAGNYIWRKDSEHLMIIKRVEIKTDPESGNHAIVTGESLESILKNRVIASRTNLSGSLQNGIKTLLNQTIISPSDQNRKISNFVFLDSKDTAITTLTVEGQYFGENLYDVVADICYTNHIGFKITLNNDKEFVFELYKGVDRSYDQNEIPHVVFSPHYDNLLNSDYIFDVDNVRNIAYIAGEEDKLDDNGKVITAQIVELSGSGKGLGRKEIFVDAGSIKRTYRDDDGKEVTIAEKTYRSQLKQKGDEELAEYFAEESFDGQILGDYQWILGKDYFIGDIVQVENEYGMTAKSRVVEMITSEGPNGLEFYPSFESAENES